MGKESNKPLYLGIFIISSSIFIYWVKSRQQIKKTLKKSSLDIFLKQNKRNYTHKKRPKAIDNYNNDKKIDSNNNIVTQVFINNEKIEKTNENINIQNDKTNSKKEQNHSDSNDEIDPGYLSDISSLADELAYDTIDPAAIPPEYQKELLLSQTSDITTESETDSTTRYLSVRTKINKYKKYLKLLFS